MPLLAQLEQFPLHTITAKGQTFSYRQAGENTKPALVLLHGIGSGSGSWLQQLQALSNDFYIVAWDAPGYGQSTALSMPKPKALDYAEALKTWLDALQINQAAVLGHSLGALVAGAFAQTYPERVSQLILANAAQGYGQADAALRETKLRERLEQIQRLGAAGLAAQRGKFLVSSAASPAQVALVQWNMQRLNLAGYAQASELMAQGHLLDDLANLTMRVLVIAGAADTITPPESVQQVATVCRAVYHVLPTGHASYIEAPEQFNQQLSQFLKGQL
ncbi:MAG: alpha/beta hydrolase [Thiolinea sp.]